MANCCSICLEEYGDGVIEITECNHSFHEACIRQWFEQSDFCPLCRHQCQNREDGEIVDIEDDIVDDDDGFIEDFQIHYYNVAEMLPIYDIFQAICLNLPPNHAGQAVRRHRIPAAFQNMMEVLPEDMFLALHNDVGTVEIIHAYLDGEFDRENPIRGYSYDSDYDPDIGRMLWVYESFARNRQINFYEAFERFLNGLRSHEEYILFRTRDQRNMFDRFNR